MPKLFKLNQLNQSTLVILVLSIFVFLFLFYQVGFPSLGRERDQTQENFGVMDYFKKNVSKEPEQLEKKHVLITAATSRLGLDLATRLAKSKCKLFVNGRIPKKVEKTVKELRKFNENVWGTAADFHNEHEIEEMFKDAVSKMRKVDTLIVIPIQSKTTFALQRTSMKEWREYQAKNIDSMIYLNNLAITHMRRNGNGKIINVSTYKGKYQTTKLAKGTEILASNVIENHTKLLSEELFKDGIAVTTIRLDVDINYYNVDFNTDFNPPRDIRPILRR